MGLLSVILYPDSGILGAKFFSSLDQGKLRDLISSRAEICEDSQNGGLSTIRKHEFVTFWVSGPTPRWG